MQSVIIVLVVVLVLEIESAKTASRTTTSTSTNRMTNKIGVPQPIFSPTKFLFRSDWTRAAIGGARMLRDSINDLIPQGGIGDPVTQALNHQKFCSRYGPGCGTTMG